MSQTTTTNRHQRLQVGILKINNKNYPIYEGVNTIGRNKEAVVNIKHLNISQNHAVIVIFNGDHFISDLNSSNGLFLENRRVEPFKLSKLKNNSSIKLGDLYGIYISQGPFSNNDQSHFEMTQDVTQSFYGSNTQILITDTQNETEDIHEAPTQEISWTAFKIPKSIKSVEKSINHNTTTNVNTARPSGNTESQEEDIHNCATQVISHFLVSKKGDSNKLQAGGVSTDHNLPKNKPSKDDFQTDSPITVGEDIHEAPTQKLPLLSDNSKNVIINEVLSNSEGFGPFNDETLPLHENNDNYVEICQIPEIDKTLDIHEAVTQVIDISKKGSPISKLNLEDDEDTDCEDNIEAVNTKTIPECCKKKDFQTTFQDEATDCEDNTQDNQLKPALAQENKNNFLESDDDSNESMDFFKVDRASNKDSKETISKSDRVKNDVYKENIEGNDLLVADQSNTRFQTESSSDETIRFKKKKIQHVSSGSDSDDEDIGFKIKKKSSMVISTQDICEKESDVMSTNLTKCDSENPLGDTAQNARTRDSYIINDTDSETEIESTSKVYLEESIQSTQDHLPADLNDTDCIPATQEVIPPLPMKSIIKSPKNTCDNAGSSEESFKLGLTELMVDPSQATNSGNSQDPCCSKSLKNPSLIFSESSLKNSENVNNIQSNDTDSTEIYMEPTKQNQNPKLEGGDKHKNLTNSHSTSDTYLAETQKIVVSEKVDANKDKLPDDLNDTEYLYEVPTQKINIQEIKPRKENQSQLNDTNDDFYFAATQKVDLKETIHQIERGDHLNATNEDIYLAPTQKVSNELTDQDQNSSREESMDALYLQPTQQLDDTFNQPTQKVNISELKLQSSNGDERGFTKASSSDSSENVIKKKFSFKKKVCCLDGSLTSILDPNPKHAQPQPFLQRQGRCSVELEILQGVDVPAEIPDRPSNPLSHILENSGELDDAVKTKEQETTTAVTEEFNTVNEISSGDDKNEKGDTDKRYFVKSETNDVKSKNVSKIDSDKISVPLDDINEEESLNDTSNKDQVFSDFHAPTKSLRTRQTTMQNRRSPKLANKMDSNLSRVEPQVLDNVKNKNVKNKLDTKPLTRRTTRRLSSSSSTKTHDSDLDSDERKSHINSERTDNSLNATSSEVNQSVALLESKITKTRKTRKSAIIQVKVPKNRKSMTISEIDEPLQNVNNNVMSKSDQEKITKESNASYDIKPSSFSATATTTRTRSKPKRRKSAEQEMQGTQTSNKTLKGESDSVTCKNNQKSKQNMLPSSEEKTNVTKVVENKSDSAATNKSTDLACRKTQRSKRKQPSELKSDTSDASTLSSDNNPTTPKKQKIQPSRQVGKRKQPSEVESDNSDSSLQSADLVTPKKQKLQPSEALLNTKERELRKQRPKVVFTMMESPQMESMIKQLGGSVIDSVDACSVLLTEHVKRSQKLLSAVGLGKPICSPKWVTDSKKTHEFLDPWDYILTDVEAEKKWNFSLKESLNRSRTRKLLSSYNFQIMVTNAADVLKGAIESCGGKCISKIPPRPSENTFIISIPENQGKFRRITKQHSTIKVIEPEAIFDGVLRQELRFSKHYLT